MNSSRRAARLMRWSKDLAGAWGLTLCLASGAAAQFTFPGDTGTTVPAAQPNPMVGVGSVRGIGTTGFRLTTSSPWQRSAVWLVNKQLVASGFQTTFQFRVYGPGGLAQYTPFGFQQGGDGFVFVVQNYGIPVVGPAGGYLGYHGLPNSLAVEFDTWWNAEYGFFDLPPNHISVHSRGVAANSVSEAASIGRTSAVPYMKDGAVHVGRIVYTPGTLQVYVDNLTIPVLTVPGLDLSSLLRLDNGSAWVGFTSATGNTYETHEILSWQFGGTGFPLTGEQPFPVTAPPTTLEPTTPSAPFVLPPPTDTAPPATTTPPAGNDPPFTFPPYQ
jgi:hypothetical protein